VAFALLKEGQQLKTEKEGNKQQEVTTRCEPD